MPRGCGLACGCKLIRLGWPTPRKLHFTRRGTDHNTLHEIFAPHKHQNGPESMPSAMQGARTGVDVADDDDRDVKFLLTTAAHAEDGGGSSGSRRAASGEGSLGSTKGRARSGSLQPGHIHSHEARRGKRGWGTVIGGEAGAAFTRAAAAARQQARRERVACGGDSASETRHRSEARPVSRGAALQVTAMRPERIPVFRPPACSRRHGFTILHQSASFSAVAPGDSTRIRAGQLLPATAGRRPLPGHTGGSMDWNPNKTQFLRRPHHGPCAIEAFQSSSDKANELPAMTDVLSSFPTCPHQKPRPATSYLSGANPTEDTYQNSHVTFGGAPRVGRGGCS